MFLELVEGRSANICMSAIQRVFFHISRILQKSMRIPFVLGQVESNCMRGIFLSKFLTNICHVTDYRKTLKVRFNILEYMA